MAKIQILGVSGYYRTNNLKANVLKALRDLKLESEVEEVSDVDVLVQSHINGIPALLVNGQVVVQQAVPDVKDLKILLKTLLKPAEANFKMEKMLVPTDFSQTAKGAYHFALEMAKSKEAFIKLVHCFHPEVDPAFPYLGVNSADFINGKKDLLKKFEHNTPTPEKGEVSFAIKVESELVTGLAAEEIVRLSDSPDVDLIVMGTTGEGGLLEKLFGSVSSDVAQKAHCPVLLIPKNVTFNGFYNVLYASNYQAADEAILRHIVDFSGFFDANIHFVHVIENTPHDFKVKTVHYEQIFRDAASNLAFRMVSVENKTVSHGIHEYVRQNDIDLVVMATSHRSFIENFMYKSTTRRMVFNTEIPLMVMHFDD